MFDGIVTSMPQIKGGKLKAYGVAAKTRSAHLPQVPTLAELGYPDLDFSNWLGTVVAASVPADLAEKINAATLKAAASPKVRDRLTAAGSRAQRQPDLRPTGPVGQDRVRAQCGHRQDFDIQLNQ